MQQVLSLLRGPCARLTRPRAAFTELPLLRTLHAARCRPVWARFRLLYACLLAEKAAANPGRAAEPSASWLVAPPHPTPPPTPPQTLHPCLAQVGADLHFAGPANQRRGRADSISKIVFQHLARTQPITLQQLQAAAAASCKAAGGGGIGDKMGSCDSSALVTGASMSVVSADGGGSMAVDRPSDGIEVDS